MQVQQMVLLMMRRNKIEMAVEWVRQCAEILELVELMSWEEEIDHLLVGSSAIETSEP